ncbi:hypothetical protein [Halosimplex amylolyticum]
MDRRRTSRVAGGLGLLFVALWFVTTPGVVSETAVARATAGTPDSAASPA